MGLCVPSWKEPPLGFSAVKASEGGWSYTKNKNSGSKINPQPSAFTWNTWIKGQVIQGRSDLCPQYDVTTAAFTPQKMALS